MKREVKYLGILRILFGFVFLWAFFDKLFGLGFATARDKAWILGNSPTTGFLFNANGVFGVFFKSLAGQVFVDWLFMLGLLLIGTALVLGIAMKITAYSGSTLMFLMWLAELPLQNNPLIDEHIIYIFVFVLLYKLKAGEMYGFGKEWIKIAKRYPILNG